MGQTNVYNLSGGNGGKHIADTNAHTGDFFVIKFTSDSVISAWTGNITGTVPTATFSQGQTIEGRFTSVTLASGSATLYNT